MIREQDICFVPHVTDSQNEASGKLNTEFDLSNPK